ncbi:MAG: uncharacterized protein KVP18_003021 [Porospora cf. gigantea A]|uniref:uncharacterized protein n=1 Tax=Porospora cf. gigantea A TaxID=2853593 RepID=UPI0035596B3E|nr:MAG: hypothetical protein KVP18_003021 [Porospora cf. gigantea A]
MRLRFVWRLLLTASLPSWLPSRPYKVKYENKPAEDNLYFPILPRPSKYDVSCQSCMEFVAGFVRECRKADDAGEDVVSLPSFCFDQFKKANDFTEIHRDECLALADALAESAGYPSGVVVSSDNYYSGTCGKVYTLCIEHKGPPECYSGLCHELVDCLDCPHNETWSSHRPYTKKCNHRGECRQKKRSAFCECDSGWRGESCNRLLPSN